MTADSSDVARLSSQGLHMTSFSKEWGGEWPVSHAIVTARPSGRARVDDNVGGAGASSRMASSMGLPSRIGVAYQRVSLDSNMPQPGRQPWQSASHLRVLE